ncbi:MAG TPA: tetratricopeptide repeat protein [Thermoanaerobaculia bacterium]|nr:tetratricopeptide repeat protein [Thermoanaerobaculia bacterium]
MNKDNALFAVIGILLGFISGYLLHEVMAARQPPRLRPGDVAAAAALGEGGEAPPGEGGTGPADASNPGPPGAGGNAPPMAAIQQLRDAVEKNPNDADAILKLANANFDIQRWDRARDLYLRYLKLRPKDADTLSDLGIAYRQLKQFDQALAQFVEAVQIAPGHWQSRYNQAVVLGIDMKRYDEALKVLAELDKAQPGNQQVQKLSAELERQKKAGA